MASAQPSKMTGNQSKYNEFIPASLLFISKALDFNTTHSKRMMFYAHAKYMEIKNETYSFLT